MVIMITGIFGQTTIDNKYEEQIKQDVLEYTDMVEISAKQYSNLLLKIEDVEFMDTNLQFDRQLNNLQTAQVVRKIENNGKYTGKSRFSSASHAYQFTKGTLRFVLSIAHRRDKLKDINMHNWTKKKNQDRLFQFYMKYNRNIANRHLPENNIITDYLIWQTGAGKTGLRNYIDVINGESRLSNSKVKTLKHNMTRKDFIKYEQYNYNKILTLIYELDLKINKAYLPSTKRLTYSEFRAIIYQHVPELKEILLDESKRTLVRIWINANICKVKRIVKAMFA
jgi:hypothetical protein